MSRIVTVAPVLGRHRYEQSRITEEIGPLLTSEPKRRALLERLHASSGVSGRSLVLPLADYADLRSFGEANAAFVRLGTELAAEAIATALDRAGLRSRDVDLLLFTSVTGVSAPSIDALLVERLGMREDVRRLPSFGLGCAGGAGGLARCHDYLLGHPGHVALLVSVELCSLTVQHGDDSTANLVASGLFGDGGAAVVLVGEAHPLAGGGTVRVVDAASRLYPGTADQLGWDVGGSGFRIVLAPGLPEVVREHLADDVEAFLERHDLKTRDVGAWVMHPGGPRILDAAREALDLDDAALTRSERVLRRTGNLSSASVLHVLAEHLAAGHPTGTWGVAAAFGPGVGSELVLLRWD